MTALPQAAIRQAERVSDLGIVVMFSLAGLTFSLALAHFGITLGAFG